MQRRCAGPLRPGSRSPQRCATTDRQSVGADGIEMSASGDERDLAPGFGQHGPETRPNRTGSDDRDTHSRPLGSSVSLAALALAYRRVRLGRPPAFEEAGLGRRSALRRGDHQGGRNRASPSYLARLRRQPDRSPGSNARGRDTARLQSGPSLRSVKAETKHRSRGGCDRQAKVVRFKGAAALVCRPS